MGFRHIETKAGSPGCALSESRFKLEVKRHGPEEVSRCVCITVKILKIRTPAMVILKLDSFQHILIRQKEADLMANTVDTDQTAPLGIV